MTIDIPMFTIPLGSSFIFETEVYVVSDYVYKMSENKWMAELTQENEEVVSIMMDVAELNKQFLNSIS